MVLTPNLLSLRFLPFLPSIQVVISPDHLLQDMRHLRKHTREATNELDKSFNQYFGSLFRSGSKQSFFSMQASQHSYLVHKCTPLIQKHCRCKDMLISTRQTTVTSSTTPCFTRSTHLPFIFHMNVSTFSSKWPSLGISLCARAP